MPWSKSTNVTANGNLSRRKSFAVWKCGRRQEVKMLLPTVCCMLNSHLKYSGGSPQSACVLWEVQPFGTVECLWESSCSSAWLAHLASLERCHRDGCNIGMWLGSGIPTLHKVITQWQAFWWPRVAAVVKCVGVYHTKGSREMCWRKHRLVRSWIFCCCCWSHQSEFLTGFLYLSSRLH